MKLQSTYSQKNNIINNNLLMRKHRPNAKHDNIYKTTRENKEMSRPTKALSFSGSVVSIVANSGTKAPSVASALIQNNNGFAKFTNKTIDFVYDNEAAYNAIYSLIVAGMIKPLAVLAMPGSDEKDKQIVATKNFLQAFIGSFMGLTIGGGFVKKSIDIVKNNLKLIDSIDDKNKIQVIEANSQKALELARDVLIKEHNSFTNKLKAAAQSFSSQSGFKKFSSFFQTMAKGVNYTPSIDEMLKKSESLIGNFVKNHKNLFEKNPDFIKELKAEVLNSKIKTTYSDAFETLWKNSTGALTAIGKAKISSILLPGVMAFLFAKKNLEKSIKEQAKQNTLTNSTAFREKDEQFQKMLKKNNSQISFRGGLSTGIDGFAKAIEYMGMSKPGAFLARTLAKTKKPSARMADLESVAITAYWVQNTTRSKKIDPSQKLGLNVHSILVTAVSSAVAFVIDWALDGLIDNTKETYKNKLTSIVKAVKEQFSEETLKNTNISIENAGAAAEMAVKETCIKLLESNKDLKANDTEGIKNIAKQAYESIKNTEVIKEAIKNRAAINEGTIENIAVQLKNIEPIREAINSQCGSIVGAKKIVKALSATDLSDAQAITKQIDSLAASYGKKLSKFKSLTIFTLVVRFLVPVIMVPFSGKLKKYIVKKKQEKTTNAKV